MRTVVKKWGNSLAVRLPHGLAAELNISEGAAVSLAIENEALVVRPARKRYQLSELLAGDHTPEHRPETDWGPPKGREVW